MTSDNRRTHIDDDWEEYKVQGDLGSNRISVPTSWAKETEDSAMAKFQRRQVGDYLIARPIVDDESREQRVKEPLENLEEHEEQLDEWTKKIGGEDLVNVYINNLLQCYFISGVKTIIVDLRGIKDTTFSERVRQAVRKATSRENRESLGEHQLRVSIEEDVDFHAFVSDTREFLNEFLIRPLDRESRQPASFFDHVTGGDILEDEEDVVDHEWSLTMRRSTSKILGLERPFFARELGALHMGVNLEKACDITERIARTMAGLEALAADEESLDELVRWVKGELQEVFACDHQDEEMMHDLIKRIATDSYEASMDLNDYLDEYVNEMIEYFRRVGHLESLRGQSPSQVSDDVPVFVEAIMDKLDNEDVSMATQIQASILIGQIFALTERLIRIPRALAQVGVGIKLLENTRDLNLS